MQLILLVVAFVCSALAAWQAGSQLLWNRLIALALAAFILSLVAVGDIP